MDRLFKSPCPLLEIIETFLSLRKQAPAGHLSLVESDRIPCEEDGLSPVRVTGTWLTLDGLEELSPILLGLQLQANRGPKAMFPSATRGSQCLWVQGGML